MEYRADVESRRRVEKLEFALLSKFFPPLHRQKLSARLGSLPYGLRHVTVKLEIRGVCGRKNDGSIYNSRRIDCTSVRLGNGSENLSRLAHRHKTARHRSGRETRCRGAECRRRKNIHFLHDFRLLFFSIDSIVRLSRR